MGDEIKYPWQRLVLDAFLASRDSLAMKINMAERAIAARLAEPQQPDLTERVALNDALRALKVLLEETRPPGRNTRKSEDIA